MSSRMIFCALHASVMHSRSRSDLALMISKTFSPNALIHVDRPMPRIMPEPKYFSMPSIDVGADVRIRRALNCWP